MLEIHGRPFLEYLIDMLREQGFERVVLLLGYLPDQVVEHFGDGHKFGVDIEYSVTPVEDDTGQRLRLAAPMIEDVFLLVYCDNYWPIKFDRVWHKYRASDLKAQITVYANDDGYSKDNVRVAADGLVQVYDKSRTAPGLKGVEIGFMLLRKQVLALMPEGNVSFEATVLPALVAEGELGAFVTAHRYYSVGSIERLAATTEFLARKPAIFLDRDGVLNKRMPPAAYVRSWSEWEWLPGALDALRLLKINGYRVILITNQPGVARGELTLEALNHIHATMTAEARTAGGEIAATYACIHGWNDGCECRKPAPGLLFQAQRDLALDLTRMWYAGDDERDEQAATAAGCRFVMVDNTTSVLDAAKRVIAARSGAGAHV